MAITNQSEYQETDDYGIDPLTDTSFDAVTAITDYSVYKVTLPGVANPAYISQKAYGNMYWWWAILHYNSLESPFDIVLGQTLKIPNINALTTNLQRKINANNTQVTF